MTATGNPERRHLPPRPKSPLLVHINQKQSACPFSSSVLVWALVDGNALSAYFASTLPGYLRKPGRP